MVSEPSKKHQAPAASAPKPEKNTDEIENRPWFIHKMVKQALWRPMFAVAFAPRSLQMFRSYAARFSANPRDDIFHGDRASRIYDRTTRSGRVFERALTPQEFRKPNLTEGERDALRASGAKYGRFAANIMTRANYVRIAGNLAALGDNLWGQGGSAAEAVVMATDTAISTSFIGVQTFYARGFHNIEQAQKIMNGAGANAAARAAAADEALGKQHLAFRNFKLGKIISYSAFGLQTAGAVIKLVNELSKGRDARLSAIVDSAVDIGQGGAYSSYNYYLVRESMKLLRGANTAGAVAEKTGFVKRATDVLSVSARSIPRGLLWTMRVLGIAGSVIGTIPSGRSLYYGITDETLPGAKRRDMIVSGTLGVLSSAAFAIGAFYITPAGLTIGTVALFAGLILLGAQTIYDERHNIAMVARKGWNACTGYIGNVFGRASGALGSISSSICGGAVDFLGGGFNIAARAVSAIGGFLGGIGSFFGGLLDRVFG